MRQRTITTGVGLLALLPVVTAALLVRPVAAVSQETAFGLYALTFTGASTSTVGEAGAGGGLAVVDSGAPSVTGRLDSSPSASVRSAPVEPGTLVRTVVGLANNEAGGETIPVPTADASYPGSQAESEVDGTGAQAFGPFTTTGYHARSTAGELAVSGLAEANDQTYADGAAASAAALRSGLAALARTYPTVGFTTADATETYRSEGGRVTATAEADPAAGTLVATVTSKVGRTTVLGQLEIASVTGTATVRNEGGTRTARARTTVGALRLGGVPVELTGDGLAVADTPLLPGQTVQELNAALGEVLSNAGLSVEALGPREDTGDGFAEADARGVRITIATAPNPQVPGNTLTLILGRAEATLSDEPPLAPLDVAPVDTGGGTDQSDTAGAVTFPSGGSDGVAGSVSFDDAPVAGDGAAAPEVAPPDAAGPASPELVMVAGRTISKRTALAAFGGWQLLSLSICTLAAFSLRRGTGAVL